MFCLRPLLKKNFQRRQQKRPWRGWSPEITQKTLEASWREGRSLAGGTASLRQQPCWWISRTHMHVSYPSEHRYTFEVLQKIVMQIDDKKLLTEGQTVVVGLLKHHGNDYVIFLFYQRTIFFLL